MKTLIIIILASLPFLGSSQNQSTYERNPDGSVDVYNHDYRGTTHEATYERNSDGSIEKYEYRDSDGARYRSSTIEENADGSYTETHYEEPPRTYDDMIEQNERRQNVGRNY